MTTKEKKEKDVEKVELQIRDLPKTVDIEDLGRMVADIIVKYDGGKILGKRTLQLPVMPHGAKAASGRWMFSMIRAGAPTVDPTQYSCSTAFNEQDTCMDYEQVDEL